MPPSTLRPAAFAHDDVIVISSDDDAPPPPRRTKRQRPTPCPPPPDLAEENANLRQQLERMKADMKAMHSQLHGLKISQQAGSLTEQDDKQSWAAAELDEVSCEVCTETLWTPYLLTCGHAFCKTCLREWFTKTLLQHEAQHPPRPRLTLLPDALLAFALDPRSRAQLAAYLHAHYPRPQYACPSCRTPARAAPIEDFPLKARVRALAAAAGVPIPAAETGVRRNPPGGGAWDAFFPPH